MRTKTASPPPPNQGSGGLWHTLACALLAAVLLLWSGLTAFGWWTQLRQTSDLDYTESWHAWSAQQAVPGGTHVGSAYAPPHNVLPYPPLGYVVNGAAGKLLGGDLSATRLAGRIVSLAMTFASAVLIVLLCATLGVRRGYGLLMALVFLNLHAIQLFAVSLRPDALACALTLAGVYAALRWQRYIPAGALLALAVFAKHSYVTAPAVLFLGLLTVRDLPAAAKVALGGTSATVIGVLIGFGFLGPHWWEGPLLQGFHGAKAGQVLYLLFIASRGAGLALALGLAAGLDPNLPKPGRFIHAIAAVSFVLNAVAMVKPGASMDYLLEPAAFSLILVGYLAERYLGGQSNRAKAVSWTAAAIALALLPGLETGVATRKLLEDNRKQPDPIAMQEYLKQVQGPILATESWMYFSTNQAPFLCPADLVSAAVDGGIIKDEPVRDLLTQKRFSAIIMSLTARQERPFPAPWQAAIDRAYYLAGNRSGADIYLPRN